MNKLVRIKCRPKDPDYYSGIFTVVDEFLFRYSGGTTREIRLSDNRIIEVRNKRNGRVLYTVFSPSCDVARDHRVTGIEFLYPTKDLKPIKRTRRFKYDIDVAFT